MKICRILDGQVETYGIVIQQQIFTKTQLVKDTGIPLPDGVKDFMFNGWCKEIETKIPNLEGKKINDCKLLAPIPNPSKIICMAFNYADHAAEQNKTPSDEPAIVLKPKTTLTGNNSKIICPKFAKKLDYEIELAVVIGKTCKNITPAEAKEAVYGFMILNDVSAREIQFGDGQFTRGKGFDTFAPCGPWITTADEIKDPHTLDMKTFVNNEIRQNSNSSNMHIKIYQAISSLSNVMTLESGDILSTGTPAGTALNNPNLEFLKHDDKIKMEIQGLGTLENTIEIK